MKDRPKYCSNTHYFVRRHWAATRIIVRTHWAAAAAQSSARIAAA
jgi:hypothetical protein